MRGTQLKIFIQVPVILVGNKIDLRGGEVTNEALEGDVLPIMNEFKVRTRLMSLVFKRSCAAVGS